MTAVVAPTAPPAALPQTPCWWGVAPAGGDATPGDASPGDAVEPAAPPASDDDPWWVRSAGEVASSDPFDDFDDDDFDDEFDDDFEEDWDDEPEDDGFGPEFQDSEGEEFDVNAKPKPGELEDEEEEQSGNSKDGKFSGDADFDN